MGREDDVKLIAYRLWQEDGCCDGHDVEHWLKAEMVWEAQNKQQTTLSPKPIPAAKPAAKAHKAAKRSRR
jgi:hypothetical protein